MSKERVTVWVGVVSLVLGAMTLGWTVYTERIPLEISEKSQFICSRRSQEGGEIWTVLYQKPNQPPKDWLYMVEEMGDGWNTNFRCNDVADRMNLYKEVGLLAFDYRKDEKTPQQWVICARTKATQNCSPVVTLMPGSEAEALEALYRVAGALMPGEPGSYQSSAPITGEKSAHIPLEAMLSED
ncbi:COP23 domain-containing protein [Spirulina major CS-329]|uniref:COP23 domain-containing protein n=1 Tax=Spirulina TaxID=1154 RepID=UPI00233092E0|nr:MULTISPECIES: COP23 domain-containing protein [Spirulina]MDB9496364.1 COP23 domain-containing protein [Spirulina subsalsa CS-330]MDB9501444.1 COP23 domain-containing protein [Spirulina major CS-329]